VHLFFWVARKKELVCAPRGSTQQTGAAES
jgi:hypothetical protein